MINWFNKILLYTIILLVSNLQLTCSSEIKLKPSNGDDQYQFGSSVSIFGKYAIVGAPMSDQNKLEDRGSAYIFEYGDEKWNQQKELLGFNRGDRFGSSVAISNNYALIGAPLEDINLSNVGSVYVYVRVENDWIFQSKMKPNDASIDACFGSSVSIDDDFAIIGAPNNNIIGSAYIFKRINNSWIQQEIFTPSDSYELNQFSNFGRRVSISANHSIIGSQKAAYIFSFDDNKWNEHSKLSLGNTSAVAISETYAIVVKSGRPLAIHDAYIYELKKNIWVKVATINTSNFYGCTYQASINNNYAIIGKTSDSFNGYISGSALIYKHIGGSWKKQTTLIASDGSEGDQFGRAVSISQNHIIISAQYKDDNSISDVGAVYIYPIDTIDPVISGYVTGLNDIPLSGATIAFDKLSSIKTNVNGYFEKDVCYNWSGKATVSFENYIFEPDFIEFSTVTNNIQNQNYKVPTSTITGFVKDNLNNPFINAKIQFDNWKTVNTDENGFYQIDIFNEWLGDANISYKDYIFDPPNISFDSIGQDLSNQNFIISVYTVSGFVKDLTGNPISGIEIIFSDEGGKTFTNSQGYYCHNVYHNWSGTVIAQGKGFKYSPQGIRYNNVSKHYPNQQYVGSKLLVSGYCLNSSNKSIRDVEITMLPDQLTTSSDNYGFYSFDIHYMWTGRLKAIKTGYSFEPNNREFQSIENSIGNQNFIGDIDTYSVTGTIFDQTSNPIDNVQLYVNEEIQNSVQTDSNGTFEIIVHSDWTGIITPQKQGYLFNPAFRSYENITENHILQNFTGIYSKVSNTPDWSVNVSQFLYQGMITAIVKDQMNNPLQSDNDILAAFVDGKCRGMITPSPVADGKRFFLQVWSDKNSEKMTIKFFDSKKNIIYTQVSPDIEFVPNLELGMISDPYVFTIKKGLHIPDANEDGEVNLIDVINVLQFITDFK